MTVQNGPVSTQRAPPMSSRDLPLACLLSALLPVAWLTTDRMKLAVARMMSATIARFRPHAVAPDGGDLFRTFGAADRAGFAAAVRALSYYEIMQLLALHAPHGRPPPVGLDGRTHLERALQSGRGAILWIAPTTFGPTLTKAALHQAGIPIWHLSRPSHGFSRSALGQAVLNPIRIRAENRFLAGRIVIRDGKTRRALEELTDCLRLNRAVSITIGTEAKDLYTLPFMNGTMTVATRPVELARQSGAALLPAVTLQDPDGTFATVIGTSLLDGNDTTEHVIGGLAAFLAPHAERRPEQFARSSVFWPSSVRPSPQVPAA